MDSTDQTLNELLLNIEDAYTTLAQGEMGNVEQWVQFLCQNFEMDDWPTIRLEMLEVLLNQVTTGSLSDPFIKTPNLDTIFDFIENIQKQYREEIIESNPIDNKQEEQHKEPVNDNSVEMLELDALEVIKKSQERVMIAMKEVEKAMNDAMSKLSNKNV